MRVTASLVGGSVLPPIHNGVLPHRGQHGGEAIDLGREVDAGRAGASVATSGTTLPHDEILCYWSRGAVELGQTGAGGQGASICHVGRRRSTPRWSAVPSRFLSVCYCVGLASGRPPLPRLRQKRLSNLRKSYRRDLRKADWQALIQPRLHDS
jgi:hypothetical protein